MGNSYPYDVNGNMTTRNVNSETFNLSYDAENRLVSVTGSNVTASFVYDAAGRQVKATINGETTLYVGQHYEVTGSSITKYYFAGSQRIALRKDNALNFIIGDHLGSSSLTTDVAGNELASMRYKAWGETRHSTGTMNTDYEYTGQRTVTEIGLHFYNARWYDSSLGRFAQADTIIPPGVQGLDRYAYTFNNPVRYTDPSGHWPDWVDTTSDSYMQGWTNFNTALEITNNVNASTIDKIIAGSYVAVWGTAHVALVIGVVGVACGLTPSCAVIAETALGMGTIASADGDPTNEISAAARVGETILDAASKTQARSLLKAGIDGLTNGQTQKALQLLGKGKLDSMTITNIGNGSVQITTQIPGGDGSSFVQYLYTLDKSGRVIQLTQQAFNALGEMVHVHDKIKDIIIK